MTKKVVGRRLQAQFPDLVGSHERVVQRATDEAGIEGEDDICQRRLFFRESRNVNFRFRHRVLGDDAVSHDHGNVEVSRNERKIVLVGKWPATELSHLARRELDISLFVGRDHELPVRADRLDGKVQSRVELRLLFVGLERKVLGVDLETKNGRGPSPKNRQRPRRRSSTARS